MIYQVNVSVLYIGRDKQFFLDFEQLFRQLSIEVLTNSISDHDKALLAINEERYDLILIERSFVTVVNYINRWFKPESMDFYGFLVSENALFQKRNTWFCVIDKDWVENSRQLLTHAIHIKAKEKQLIENNHYYEIIIDNMHEFFYIEKKKERKKNYTYCKTVKNIIGYASDDKILESPESIIHAEDLHIFNKDVFSLSMNADINDFVDNIRYFNKASNKYIWVERRLIPQFINDEFVSVVALCRDINEKKLYENKILKYTHYDSLTELPNRLYFVDSLDRRLIKYQKNSHHHFSVFYVNLDRFKKLNDLLGRKSGNMLIKEIATRLTQMLRNDDLVAHLGGDEFCLLLNKTQYLHETTYLAERIQDIISTPFVINGQEIVITASIGIAVSHNNYCNSEDIIKDAETAMHKAKSEGKIRYAVFDSELHLYVATNLNLENDLRHAIENNELYLEFQPIIALDDYTMTSVEALARWKHPSKGLISPMEFTPIAEETGLIINLGEWILREAASAMQSWISQQLIPSLTSVSINISSVQLTQIDLCDKIDQIIQEYCLPPSSLKLEITESVIMDNVEHIHAVLAQFKSMGIQLSMDDFGTGYSSLSYLHRLPVNTLKIDRSFVLRITEKHNSSNIVDTIIKLAHNLCLDVVAEGIETEVQANYLRRLGCEYGQGFFFSQPVAADKILRLANKLTGTG